MKIENENLNEPQKPQLNIGAVSGSYSLPMDINGVQIKKGDKIRFNDLIWNGFGSVSYPRREGVVTEIEMDGMNIPCIDYSLSNYERIAFFNGDSYRKYEVVL